jgi:hypothetical protein
VCLSVRTLASTVDPEIFVRKNFHPSKFSHRLILLLECTNENKTRARQSTRTIEAMAVHKGEVSEGQEPGSYGA